MKKIILVVCVLLLTLSLFSCATPSEPENPTTYLTLISANTSEYAVVRSDLLDGKSLEVTAAVELRTTMNEVAEAKMKITTDWVKRGEEVPVGTREILVGKTNRPESEAALSLIDETQFIVKVYDDRVVLVGATEEGTMDAVLHFLAEFAKGAEIKIPDDYEYIGTTTYVVPIPPADPNSRIMTLSDPAGPITDAELYGYKNYIKSSLARPVTNIGNKLVYGTQGLATEAMGLMYEITSDVEILDVMIEFCDKMLYCRNDMPGGDGRKLWTGKVEPAWPNKDLGTEHEGYASSENGDIVGHILYCAYLILQDEALCQESAPKSTVALDCGETYRDRAMYYLTMCEQTLAYLDHFVRKDSLRQRFPTDPGWLAMNYNNKGGHYPVNQQMMFNNGFMRAQQIYLLLGREADAKKYNDIIRVSLALIKADWKLKTKDGYEYYNWTYELPNGTHYEDFGHGAFDCQGFYRLYQSGLYSDILTETDMIRLGNSVKYAYWNPAKNAFEHNWKDERTYGGPRSGWALISLYSEVSREIIFDRYVVYDLRNGSTNDSGLFGHMLYVKYQVYGSALQDSVVTLADRKAAK